MGSGNPAIERHIWVLRPGTGPLKASGNLVQAIAVPCPRSLYLPETGLAAAFGAGAGRLWRATAQPPRHSIPAPGILTVWPLGKPWRAIILYTTTSKSSDFDPITAAKNHLHFQGSGGGGV